MPHEGTPRVEAATAANPHGRAPPHRERRPLTVSVGGGRMGFWLLVLAGAATGWMVGGGSGSLVGIVAGMALALVGHQLQRRAFLFGIHTAARVGNVGRVRELLAKNSSLVNSRDASGNTPLH